MKQIELLYIDLFCGAGGNAVEVNMSRVLCEALSRKLIENEKHQSA